MRIAFRTDASLQIGTGHVMRCLTLADALRDRGAQCHFICREHPGNLIDLIRHRGYVVHTLPCDQNWLALELTPSHANWLGSDWKADAEQTKVGAGGTAIDWLIVDHYALDRRWESSMRAHCRKLMVIDDLADRPHDCDLLLDQNLGRSAQDYAGLLSPDAITLIGPQFALLRPEFAALRPQSLARRAQSPQFKHLLITMGGVDKDNGTGQVLNALKLCDLPHDLRISVVMGPHAPWLPQVQAQATQMPWSTQVLVGVSNMAQIMADSDVAIGAAGSTSWERCCLGLPSLIVVLASNQQQGAIAMQNASAVIVLKSYQCIPKALDSLQSLDSSNSQLLLMTQASAGVCDGVGVERVFSLLADDALSARAVTFSDEMLLFSWANDALTRMNAFNTSRISLADHQAWLARRLANVNECAMFIIERGHVPIGQVRFDRGAESEWAIDYAVAPDCRGQGLGAAVLGCGLAAFSANTREGKLTARVKFSNLPSCRVFESLNFEKELGANGVISYFKPISPTV